MSDLCLLQAHRGGWSNLWGTIAPDRWPSFARRNSRFLKQKAHFGGRKLQDDLSAQGCPLLPSRRRYIPKADGKQRPPAVAALEDKIVQSATAAVLNAIYEEDFLGLSYGFRPKRGQHNALDALVVGIVNRR
jgi:retron-type reverse transcriptase